MSKEKKQTPKYEKAADIPCATCAARVKAEQNPKSFSARLWKWHTSWCPGWKSYQKALQAEATTQNN